MKNLPILVPAVLVGVLATAAVLAAPQSDPATSAKAGVMDRAAAYALAMAK